MNKNIKDTSFNNNASDVSNLDAILHINNLVDNKRVLYISTTYIEYLRVQQEISIINNNSKQVHLIVSSSKYYFIRLTYVYLKCIFICKEFDVVFIGFAPQLVLPLLNWKFSKKIIIIDFFISLYDTLVMDRQAISKYSLASKLLKYIDTLTLSLADHIISDTNAHAEYFINELGCDRNKVITLYLNADSKYYYPKQLTKPTNYHGKYIVTYFGSGIPLQGTEIIIEMINLCQISDIFFILIGPFTNNRTIINKNVKCIPWLDQKKLSDYIAISDICLAGHFSNSIDKAYRTIPGKAYIYEAMNKMIILGENQANRERYPKYYNTVKFVNMGSSIDLLDVINKCHLDYKNEK